MSHASSLHGFWMRSAPRLDKLAIGLSGLCLIHCIASAVFFGLLATAGGLFSPWVHEAGLTLAILFGAVSLGQGIVTHQYMTPAAVGAFGLGIMAGALQLPHGGPETIWTLVGVSLVALGHDLNRRAAH